MPEIDAAFARGRESGDIAARLESAEERLQAINGHLGDVANELRVMGLGFQGLADRFDAAAATTIATAEALEKANVARREKENESWSPLQKAILVLGGISTLIAMVLAFQRFAH